MRMRIAVVEDDPAQLELIRQAMRTIGHEPHAFTRGRDLLNALRHESFDLLIVDWQLPDLSGPDIVLWVRSNVQPRLPVLFVTSRVEERDLVEGLACGADDYMTKPTRVGELIARVRALARRSAPITALSTQTVGRYRIDRRRRVIEMDGEAVTLQHKEYELAQYLFANLGQLLPRERLLRQVWGHDTAADSSRSLDTYVGRLRLKLQLQPQNGLQLSTVYGVGYRLDDLAESRTRDP
jgi:DNA-binding response OmpR family regulator